MFQVSSTQLRFSFGGVAGFDYPAVQWVADKLGIVLDATMLHKLRAMERKLIELINAKEEK